MKGIDIFCKSQASTAICLTMGEASSSSSSPPSSSSSTIHLGSGRAIDRYNPIIRDPRRLGQSTPSSLSQPITDSPRPLVNSQSQNIKNGLLKKKKKSKVKFGITDEKKKNISVGVGGKSNNNNIVSTRNKSWSCTKPGDFISPPGSSRYLLSHDQANFSNLISDFDPVLKLVPIQLSTTQIVDCSRKDEPCSPPKPPCTSSRSPDQVVVLRVSLHCRGCERKMRKHISRMEGVSSFNIDFAAKKVTVVGNVTPLGVLNSISKVKNAQLWAPSMPPTIIPIHQNNSDM